MSFIGFSLLFLLPLSFLPPPTVAKLDGKVAFPKPIGLEKSEADLVRNGEKSGREKL